jgi:hypothetical protein
MALYRMVFDRMGTYLVDDVDAVKGGNDDA